MEERPQLFACLSIESSRYWHQVQAKAEHNLLSFPPSQIDQLGHVLFSNLGRGGFCTQVVTGRQPWNPQSYYFEAARLAARRGCKIERAFLLPHRHCRHDQSLRDHVARDNAAGIATHVLYIGDLLSTSELPLMDSLDFGLWDDEILCVAVNDSNGSIGGPGEWRVSGRREDTQRAQSLIDILKSKAPRIDLNDSAEAGASQQERLDLEEPMITTAPITDFLSTVLCRGNHVSSEDCSWYHSVWQYLRVFNMVSTPTWHAKFYRDELGTLAKSGNFGNALISGTADYSMLANLLWAYRLHAADIVATVLDLCETPLMLCKWYAKLVSGQVKTVTTDIFDFEVSPPFDLIVTDAFLTRFPPEMRARIVQKWASLVRSDGRVVTTVRIEPGLASESIRATPAQADAFRRRALQEARRWQDFLGVVPEEIANKAQRYAERMTSFSIKSTEEVKQLFEASAFQIEKLELVEVPGEMISSTYVDLVARRN